MVIFEWNEAIDHQPYHKVTTNPWSQQDDVKSPITIPCPRSQQHNVKYLIAILDPSNMMSNNFPPTLTTA